MRRIILSVLLLMAFAAGAFAQTKPSIGVRYGQMTRTDTDATITYNPVSPYVQLMFTPMITERLRLDIGFGYKISSITLGDSNGHVNPASGAVVSGNFTEHGLYVPLYMDYAFWARRVADNRWVHDTNVFGIYAGPEPCYCFSQKADDYKPFDVPVTIGLYFKGFRDCGLSDLQYDRHNYMIALEFSKSFMNRSTRSGVSVMYDWGVGLRIGTSF